MAKRILLLGLSILLAASMSAQAATLFEDNFDGTTLDTGKWTTAGDGTVTVSDGNVTLDVPSGDWAYSQLTSVSLWTAGSDLYYSFTVGELPQGVYNLFQVYGGSAQTGYVAMRSDLGDGQWWFDVREDAAGSSAYRGKDQPGAIAPILNAGDIFTLKLGPAGSAAYKNGNLFDSCSVVPTGTLTIDAQCWRAPGTSASQTFDSISVSDTEPIPTIPPVEPPKTVINMDFNGTRNEDPDPITYQPIDGTVYNGILFDSRNNPENDDNLTVSASNLLDSEGNTTTVGFSVSPVGGDQAPEYTDPLDVTSVEALVNDYLFVHSAGNSSDAPFSISGLDEVQTINIILGPGTLNPQDVVIEGSANLGGRFYDVPVVDGQVTGVIGNGSGNVCVIKAMTIEIPAIPGDANLDGAVDVTDLGILATNYGIASGLEWGQGDFTGDGAVDVSDLGILATSYGTGTVAQAVPEPSMLVMLVAGLATLVWRRRA